MPNKFDALTTENETDHLTIPPPVTLNDCVNVLLQLAVKEREKRGRSKNRDPRLAANVVTPTAEGPATTKDYPAIEDQIQERDEVLNEAVAQDNPADGDKANENGNLNPPRNKEAETSNIVVEAETMDEVEAAEASTRQGRSSKKKGEAKRRKGRSKSRSKEETIQEICEDGDEDDRGPVQ